MEIGYAYYEIIVDDGIASDFILLDANKTFEEIICINKEIILGKRISEVFPGIEIDLQDLIRSYLGKTGLTLLYQKT